jgi:hypothetical protein
MTPLLKLAVTCGCVILTAFAIWMVKAPESVVLRFSRSQEMSRNRLFLWALRIAAALWIVSVVFLLFNLIGGRA